jgi:hypothetical protein
MGEIGRLVIFGRSVVASALRLRNAPSEPGYWAQTRFHFVR